MCVVMETLTGIEDKIDRNSKMQKFPDCAIRVGIVSSEQEFYEREQEIVETASAGLGYQLELCSITPEKIIRHRDNGVVLLQSLPERACAYIEIKNGSHEPSAVYFLKKSARNRLMNK